MTELIPALNKVATNAASAAGNDKGGGGGVDVKSEGGKPKFLFVTRAAHSALSLGVMNAAGQEGQQGKGLGLSFRV